jgi:hypothetical protein
VRLYSTDGVLVGSESRRRMTRDSPHPTLALDPVPGSTGLFDVPPGQHISSTASVAA